MLSTYPIWLFDSPGVPEWATFGLHLVTEEPAHAEDRKQPPVLSRMMAEVGHLHGMHYLASLFYTMKSAHDRLYIEEHNFARTIAIPTLGVSMIDFHLSPQTSVDLYMSGRKAAEEFLETWNFKGYIAEHRSGKPQPSRRQRIAERLHQASGKPAL